MRKLLGLGMLVVAGVLAGVLILPTAENKQGKLSPEEAAYYKYKRFNRLPKAMRQPSNYFFEQRAYPYDSIPYQRYYEAVAEAKVMQRRQEESALSGEAISWNPAGPTNVPGRISCIDVDPTNPNVVWSRPTQTCGIRLKEVLSASGGGKFAGASSYARTALSTIT